MDTSNTVPPLPPLTAHVRHVAHGAGLAALIIICSLAIGTTGYHYFERLPWLDAELNAAMILTGMGPVDHPATVGGKLFASAFALFSGLVFLSTAALILTPLAKRALHGLHLDLQPSRRANSSPDRR